MERPKSLKGVIFLLLLELVLVAYGLYLFANLPEGGI